MSGNQYNGVLAVDKPLDISSHDLVQKIRKICGQRSIGHTGTLDPKASGLMILCIGRSTKLAAYITGHDKTYEAVVRLGQTSRTYDAEGINPESKAIPNLSLDKINDVLSDFVGSIEQRVPAYSAIRVDGRRLYEMARKGETVNPPTRQVNISSIILNEYIKPDINITVNCSKGTYIRSLAHDIGQNIGCGAYLAGLRRTQIGHTSISQAWSLSEIENAEKEGRLEKLFLDTHQVLDFHCVTIADEFKALLQNGRQPTANDIIAFDDLIKQGERVLLRDSQGSILAIGTTKVAANVFALEPTLPIIDFDRVLI